MMGAAPFSTVVKETARAAGLWNLLVLMVFASAANAADIAVLHNGFTIRHDHHVVMGATTRLFYSSDEQSFIDVATADVDSYQVDLTPPPPPPVAAPAPTSAGSATNAAATRPVPPRAPVDLNQVVNSASANYHLDPDLVNSVIHAESGFNAHAISPKGARGLMQLMPSTADQLGVKDSFDPENNVGGGSRYLRELLERYNFDLVKALAAYNAGPERVDQYHGVPPFYETKAYVARIIREYNQKIAKEEREAARAQKLVKVQASKSATTHTASAGTSSPHTNAWQMHSTHTGSARTSTAHTSTGQSTTGGGAHAPPASTSAQIATAGSNSSH